MLASDKRPQSLTKFSRKTSPPPVYTEFASPFMEMPESMFEEEMKKVDCWLSELRSLGIAGKKYNEVNDSKELHDLTDNIKDTLCRKYKTAYAEA